MEESTTRAETASENVQKTLKEFRNADERLAHSGKADRAKAVEDYLWKRREHQKAILEAEAALGVTD